ncbi:Vacuolar protein sorting-associated like protein 28 [Monoraphidium neglectum]|uniref:Vacuolar protein sorting-associated protein 28 homolog n=1 Tax=Monoraphidium neglectum TaxID=145388 RepID=A0A0D2MEH6_9CHLO|nr:Vacuolar protein sorting-associated like protein 28 [Monoraphidium neglectum]KIZ01545.1 Vacuolar protein sorting-associated like protein 28 [Monoraphidium neglectum]|eukprot:XP_013900564.1 Vacuolar protein sorting-associated like protein 28 [Monoraphidium neglectum]
MLVADPATLLEHLFAIIKATEKLERAYVRDDVTAADYEGACEKLIAQFKVLWGSMRDAVPSVETFMQQYHMQCPMAWNRLVKVGLPATIEHRKRPVEGGGGGARAVAETVQHFITAMDSLKLNLVAVDQICPILSDLISSMSKIASLPPEFAPKAKAKNWYSRLYQQPASYELSEDEVRQLLFDLESSYNEFISTIK